MNGKIELDLTITPELKEEGNVREIIRQIQQMRKNSKFIPKDRIIVYYNKSDFLEEILKKNKEYILEEVLANDFILSIEELKEIEIDENKIYLGIKKI